MKIIDKIKDLMNENIQKYLPNVRKNDLEENGAIYYMNGNMGTANDWYFNNKLSDFMMFYDDKDKNGAIKLILYKDGTVKIFIYDKNGKKLVKEVNTMIEVNEDEILKLAVILYNEGDNKSKFDINVDNINFEIEISNNIINDFKNGNYEEEKFDGILDKKSFVSNRIVSDNWNVGYMYREEVDDIEDSGWRILSAIDDQEYIDDINNIDYIKLGFISKLDPVILKYLDADVGTSLVRVSEEEFEIDDDNKKIFESRRND